MSIEAARLVDELTTLLYEVLKRWEANGRVCEIVQCGACHKKADKPESVVHDSACPVYRLQRADDGITAVIRANADEIADLQDVRDDLQAKVNALTVEMECRNELLSRINALTAENARLRERVAALEDTADDLLSHPTPATDDAGCWFCCGGLGNGPNGHKDTCAWRRMRAALAQADDGGRA